jgi:hypothetical protein
MGYDMGQSSPLFVAALARGAKAIGVKAAYVGMLTTPNSILPLLMMLMMKGP